MPTYVYRFLDSDETIEVHQSFSDAALTEAVHPGHRRRAARCARCSRPSASRSRARASTRPTAGVELVDVLDQAVGLDTKSESKPTAVRPARRPRPARTATAARARRARRARRDRSSESSARHQGPHPQPRRPQPQPLTRSLDGPAARRAEIGVFGGSGFYSFFDGRRGRRRRDALRRAVGPVTIGHGRRPARRLPAPPRAAATSSRPTPSRTGPTSGPCASWASAA